MSDRGELTDAYGEPISYLLFDADSDGERNYEKRVLISSNDDYSSLTVENLRELLTKLEAYGNE